MAVETIRELKHQELKGYLLLVAKVNAILTC